jgi:hypothetical protein
MFSPSATALLFSAWKQYLFVPDHVVAGVGDVIRFTGITFVQPHLVVIPSTALGSYKKKKKTVGPIVGGLFFLAALASLSLSIHLARRRRHGGSGAYNDGAHGTEKRRPLPILPMQAGQTPVQQLIHRPA